MAVVADPVCVGGVGGNRRNNLELFRTARNWVWFHESAISRELSP